MSSKQAEFLDQLKLTDEERVMRDFLADAVAKVLAQIDKIDLIIGALCFAFTGNGPLLQRAIDDYCESNVVGIGATRHEDVLGLAVSRFTIPQHVLLNSSQVPFHSDGKKLHQALRMEFIKAHEQGEIS